MRFHTTVALLALFVLSTSAQLANDLTFEEVTSARRNYRNTVHARAFANEVARYFTDEIRNFNQIRKLIAQNRFTYESRPQLLSDSGPLTWNEFTSEFDQYKAILGFTALNYEVYDEIASGDKVVLFATSVGTVSGVAAEANATAAFGSGTDDYQQDYMATFTFNDRGKILAVTEFIDSAYFCLLGASDVCDAYTPAHS